VNLNLTFLISERKDHHHHHHHLEFELYISIILMVKKKHFWPPTPF